LQKGTVKRDIQVLVELMKNCLRVQKCSHALHVLTYALSGFLGKQAGSFVLSQIYTESLKTLYKRCLFDCVQCSNVFVAAFNVSVETTWCMYRVVKTTPVVLFI